jgi:chorismate dehydratase
LQAKLVELDKKIRVGAVSYLNTKPLLYGIKRSGLMDRIELIEEYPSRIATMLVNDGIDMGLVPVAIIPELKEPYIVSDYCIGAEVEVASVCLFSEVPIMQVEKVFLDYQSRTSVNLVKVLLKYHWKKEVVLENAKKDFCEHITGTSAGVVIGDRALEQRKKSKYVYDLASEWIKMTGLPFVFAAWIANKKLDPGFIKVFNNANAYGLQHLDEVIAENYFESYDLNRYYRQNISYELTEEKKKGLKKFLEYLNKMDNS